ncbi:hypothetical protein D3C86_2136670 [compost metagenome]
MLATSPVAMSESDVSKMFFAVIDADRYFNIALECKPVLSIVSVSVNLANAFPSYSFMSVTGGL